MEGGLGCPRESCEGKICSVLLTDTTHSLQPFSGLGCPLPHSHLPFQSIQRIHGDVWTGTLAVPLQLGVSVPSSSHQSDL